MFSAIVILFIVLKATASPIVGRVEKAVVPPANGSVVDALWDGLCYYPKSASQFQLDQYIGKWYQLAATDKWFSKGCTCSTAEYSLANDGSVNVLNSCQRDGSTSVVKGSASPVNKTYGDKGVFRVKFPGIPNVDPCPGPNYIVQVVEGDWAIVQAANWNALFILNRKQNVMDTELDVWLKRAESLGSSLKNVTKTVQTGCK